MLTDLDCAKAVAAAYGATPTVSAGDDVRAVISRVGDEIMVAVPGTTDLLGWLRDFSAWPAWFPALGLVHEGFGDGSIRLWREVAPYVDKPGTRAVYVGHSLGGAMAQGLAVLHAAAGLPPCRVVTLGSPRVATLVNPAFRIAAARALEWRLYARAEDPVIEVPFAPAYLHAAPLVRLGAPVGGLDPAANHNIALYVEDLARSGRSAAT